MSRRKELAETLRSEAESMDTTASEHMFPDTRRSEAVDLREAADLLDQQEDDSTVEVDLAQTVADNLTPIIPARWGIYSTEITLRAGMSAQPSAAAVTVRATIGPAPYRPREISGVGPDLATAIVDLHNRAREVKA